MAPRSRLLDLERDDVDALFFYGAYHQNESDDSVSVATYGIVFWPIFLVAGLLLQLIAPFPFPYAAAVCGALYVAYCFFLDRAAQPTSSSPWPSVAAGVPARQNEWPSRPHCSGHMVAGDTTTEQMSQ